MVERLASAKPAAPKMSRLEKPDRLVVALDPSEPDRVAGTAKRLLAR